MGRSSRRTDALGRGRGRISFFSTTLPDDTPSPPVDMNSCHDGAGRKRVRRRRGWAGTSGGSSATRRGKEVGGGGDEEEGGCR